MKKNNEMKKNKKKSFDFFETTYGIKRRELDDALGWFYSDDEIKEIKSYLTSSSLKPGESILSTNSGKEISIKLDNNNKLTKIGHITFYEHLKYRRALYLWTYIDKDEVWKKLKDKSFHQRSFSDINDFTQYIAYIFYAKAFYHVSTQGQGSEANKNNQGTFALIQSYVNNNSHFKFITIGTESYVVMDSLLIYNYERVFCIFKEDKNPQDGRYNLDTICTKKEIIYTENTTNLKLENYIKDEKDYPQREIKITDDNTLIRFESDSVMFHFEGFWKHIFSDDDHENRIKEIKRIKEITTDTGIINGVKIEIKNLITETIKKEVELQQKINKRIFPNDAFIYINNKGKDFFPEIYRSCFLDFEFGGEIYYLVFRIEGQDDQNDDRVFKEEKVEDNTSKDNQNDDILKPKYKFTLETLTYCATTSPIISKPKYKFVLETLYTKEFYENRFKME